MPGTDAENRVNDKLPEIGEALRALVNTIAGEKMNVTLIVWNQLPQSDVLTFSTIDYATVAAMLEHMLAQLLHTDPSRKLVRH